MQITAGINETRPGMAVPVPVRPHPSSTARRLKHVCTMHYVHHTVPCLPFCKHVLSVDLSTACRQLVGSLSSGVVTRAVHSHVYSPDASEMQISFDILRRRLNMENPHKQWLAVDLVRHVLGACNDRLRPFRSDLIREVARVADKPNKKGSLPAQQNARKSALEFLQSCGQEGHQALTLVQNMQRGAAGGRNMPMGPMGMMGPGGMPYGQPYYTQPQQGAEPFRLYSQPCARCLATTIRRHAICVQHPLDMCISSLSL